jgi:hypothetical protein
MFPDNVDRCVDDYASCCGCYTRQRGRQFTEFGSLLKTPIACRLRGLGGYAIRERSPWNSSWPVERLLYTVKA